jgi:hypothetical protein
MGCFSSKDIDNPEVSTSKPGHAHEKDSTRQEVLDSGYLFIIREVSANNEESAFPSRFQSNRICD